jgi:hemoglobin
MPFLPDDSDTPYARLGGREAVLALAERFYDAMESAEPGLAALHPQDSPGKIARSSRDRFALFLVGWLGGPQDYTAVHGHPRLRMRHGAVPIDSAARDAWLRCMAVALGGADVDPGVRRWLDQRFREVADFMRNRPDADDGPKMPV